MKYLFLISGSQQTGTFLGIRAFLFFWQNTDFEKEMACVYSLYAGVILVSLQRISSFPLSPSFSLSLSVSFFALSLIHSLLHPSSFALMLIHDQGTSLSKRQMTSSFVLNHVAACLQLLPCFPFKSDFKKCFKRMPWLQELFGPSHRLHCCCFCWVILLWQEKNARPNLFTY